jgi:hypothetical protein
VTLRQAVRIRREEFPVQRSRLERVLDALARQPTGTLPFRLCSAAAVMLDSPGVGIAMADNDHLQTVCAIGIGRDGEELQLTLGEGPAYDAYRYGEPVLIDQMDDEPRWPLLGRDAGGAGIRAIFSFPLRLGAARFGAFTLYGDEPGPLDDGQYQDTVVFAKITLDLLLTMQADQSSGDLHDLFTEDGANPWQIHQATGMVSAQLGIPIQDALAVLRGTAFSSGRSISATAADVVAGRLVLDDG